MYENDSVMRNSRPAGANSIETRLFICLYTRDYEYELKIKPELQYMPYIIERFKMMFKPPDENTFTKLIELEIANSVRYSFITPNGQLTPRGLFFIESALNGAYMYTGTRFDNLVATYMTALTMEGVNSSGIGEEVCACEECEPEFIPQEPPKEVIEPPEYLKVDIPMKDFIHLINKYKTNSFWNKLKGLFSG